jgi:hypothetical protein
MKTGGCRFPPDPREYNIEESYQALHLGDRVGTRKAIEEATNKPALLLL